MESLVLADNFYRQVEQSIDLSFVRELATEFYSNIGRTSADPVVFFKLHYIEVSYPERQLIETVNLNLALRWFSNTDYNEESFIVRHAFTGVDNPYDQLKRALRAEIDEYAWSALYSTKSYSFEKPTSGKITVKVINHYGDEV